MSYLKIPNLYKSQDILLFKECYALEKIHGTSTHISWNEGELRFFSGGEKYENFIKLFDHEFLTNKFKEIGLNSVIVNGEGYGGKCQGMSATYGKELKFVAFDVRINGKWLVVPQACDFAVQLGLEFVHFDKIKTDLDAIDVTRDADSVQAVRNGMGNGHKREGVVLRPLVELIKNNGERIIAKHKRDEFRERETPQKIVDPEKLKVLSEANSVADEWITLNRIKNALSHFPVEEQVIDNMGNLIRYLVEDVIREGDREIILTAEVKKALSKKAAALLKTYFHNFLLERV